MSFMGVVAGVVSIVAVVVTLIIGTILVGAFTTVADTWKAAVNATGGTAITAFNIASLLPIAIVAGLVIAVIFVIIVSKSD